MSETSVRRGKFLISREMVKHQPKSVRIIMGKCIIMRCEFIFEYNAFEYHAISPLFDKVAEGEVAPRYFVSINGYRKVKFENSRR